MLLLLPRGPEDGWLLLVRLLVLHTADLLLLLLLLVHCFLPLFLPLHRYFGMLLLPKGPEDGWLLLLLHMLMSLCCLRCWTQVLWHAAASKRP
jgi:hypothetical protein